MGLPRGLRGCHVIIETESEHVGYRFWLISRRGGEPLEFAPGKPYRIDGRPVVMGAIELGWVGAAPVDVADPDADGRAVGETRGTSGELPPGVLRSEELDFSEAVPFYDTRQEVVDTYRLELVQGEPRRSSYEWARNTALVGSRFHGRLRAFSQPFPARCPWVGVRFLGAADDLAQRQSSPMRHLDPTVLRVLVARRVCVRSQSQPGGERYGDERGGR